MINANYEMKLCFCVSQFLSDVTNFSFNELIQFRKFHQKWWRGWVPAWFGSPPWHICSIKKLRKGSLFFVALERISVPSEIARVRYFKFIIQMFSNNGIEKKVLEKKLTHADLFLHVIIISVVQKVLEIVKYENLVHN